MMMVMLEHYGDDDDDVDDDDVDAPPKVLFKSPLSAAQITEVAASKPADAPVSPRGGFDEEHCLQVTVGL
jgi:hypothetical protein